jgi:hypothetical protein
VITVLGTIGCLAVAASYVFGAPVSVAVLVPGMALVAVVMLSSGVRAAAVTCALAAAAFLFVQLAAVEQPIGVDFGTGSAALDLPTLFGGAGARWLPTVLGVAALLIVLFAAGLVRHAFNAARTSEEVYRLALKENVPPLPASATGDEDVDGVDAFPMSILRAAHDAGFRLTHDPSSTAGVAEPGIIMNPEGDAHATPRSPDVAALVRVSLEADPDGAPVSGVSTDRLAEMVGEVVGGWRDRTVVKSDEDGSVMMLLPGADDPQAHALVHQLEDTARRKFRRSLDSAVLVLESSEESAMQEKATDMKAGFNRLPDADLASPPETEGGS